VITLPTARLDRSADGIPVSPEFKDVYHSADGGLAQSRHVFLAGNDIPARWQARSSFVILETGFGLGLNFLAAWDAWRRDARRPRRMHFISVEKRPFAGKDLAAALAPFAELEPLAKALVSLWPPPLAGFHRLHFDAGNVILTLLFGDVHEVLPQLVGRVDAFFLDGFTPARNAGMWSPDVVRELARLATPESTIATWTVAGGVRTALTDAGFRVEKRVGFGSKREMLAGSFRSEKPAAATTGSRRAIVVGGGLAGTLAAEVDLIDAGSERSVAAVGLLRPIANLRDAINAQVSRAAFLYALQHYRALQYDGYHLQWSRCGVLQLAEDDDEAARLAAIAGSQGYPPAFLEFVAAERANEIAARPVRGPGWWFPHGAWVAPESLMIASLARAGARIRPIAPRHVARIERDETTWRALDADDHLIAEAPVLILANAADAKRLAPEARLTLSEVRGQVTYLPPSPERAVEIVVSGSGYVAPVPQGGHCAGASYHHDDGDTTVRASDHRDNLARAEAMLPGFTAGIDPLTLGGWTGFRTTVPDRLPVFGASAIEGLYTATGLGSRGLLWAPLGAELLACQLEGEPLPLSRDLAGAISPRRFLS